MPDELAEFESDLRARGDVVFLAVPMPGPGLREVAGLEPLPGDYGGRFLARREDLGRIKTVRVQATGQLMVVASASPVVELSRCRIDPSTGALRRGRLYFMTPGRGGLGFDAGAEFIKWADGLLTWFRKNKDYRLQKEPAYRGIYISIKASEWRERGGILGPP